MKMKQSIECLYSIRNFIDNKIKFSAVFRGRTINGHVFETEYILAVEF